MELFRDRTEAGTRLARRLLRLGLHRRAGEQPPVVLALPRGGLPVAAPIAAALDVPLDVIVSRKLGVPGQPELGFGAVAEGGALWIDPRARTYLSLRPEIVDAIAERVSEDVQARVASYRGGKPLPDLRGRTVILVDDGVATGGTLRAAIRAIRRHDPGRLVAAIPIAAADTAAELREEVDDWVCLEEPELLWAISRWYASFPQLSEEEVRAYLRREETEGEKREEPPSPPPESPPT